MLIDNKDNGGYLGLPKKWAGPSVFDVSAPYVDERKYSSIIEERLKFDTRAQSLEGHHIRNGAGATRYDHSIIAHWWVWRANIVGTAQADLELDEYLNSSFVDTWECCWILGVDIDFEVKINPSFSLIPLNGMPESRQRQLSELSLKPVSFITPIGPTSAIVRKSKVRKLILENPLDDRTDWAEKYSNMFEIAYLLNVIPGVCSVPHSSQDELPDWVPPGALLFGSSGRISHDIVPMQLTKFPNEFNDLEELVSAYFRADENIRERFKIALRRLAQSKSRLNLEDKILDVGIALEMLLLNGLHGGEKIDQLSLTFRLRGAWLLGVNAAERRIVYGTLKRAYELRSQIAHNGSSQSFQKMTHEKKIEQVKDIISVAERVFMKLIIRGMPSNWDDIILGS